MLDLPRARQYTFMPVSRPDISIPVGDVRPCGTGGLTFSQLLMDEIAKIMTEDDIVGYSGITNETCLIIVNFDEKHARDIIVGGHISTNRIFEEHPHLMPAGGFALRDWDDIPDEEKAGNPKNKK